MTLLPILKVCPKCHKKYSYNPDLGHLLCPYCHGLGKVKKFDIKKILKKRTEDGRGM